MNCRPWVAGQLPLPFFPLLPPSSPEPCRRTHLFRQNSQTPRAISPIIARADRAVVAWKYFPKVAESQLAIGAPIRAAQRSGTGKPRKLKHLCRSVVCYANLDAVVGHRHNSVPNATGTNARRDGVFRAWLKVVLWAVRSNERSGSAKRVPCQALLASPRRKKHVCDARRATRASAEVFAQRPLPIQPGMSSNFAPRHRCANARFRRG